MFAYTDAIHTTATEFAHPNGKLSTPSTNHNPALTQLNQTRLDLMGPESSPR